MATVLTNPSFRDATQAARQAGSRLTSLAVYALGALVSIAIGPALFALGDRETVLMWSNRLLDMLG